MAALGWLLNLGFAASGAGAVVEEIPQPRSSGGGGLYPLSLPGKRKRKNEVLKRPIDWSEGFSEAPALPSATEESVEVITVPNAPLPVQALPSTSVQMSALDAELHKLLIHAFEIKDAQRQKTEQNILSIEQKQDLFNRRKRMALLLLLRSV